ncbi:MAG: cyclase family protein [Candidatus Tectimicrobiota bacterium]
MRLYDITMPVSARLPVYPGDPPVTITPLTQIAGGDAANVSQITLSSHTGTHLDVPRHFFSSGATVDAISMHTLLGPVRVCDFSHVTTHLSAHDFRSCSLEGVTRVLCKTPNAALWQHTDFQETYIALTESAAVYLLEQGIQLVGIDYLSIDAFDRPDFPVHRALLAAGVLILEGLDLRLVPAGDYELLALPLLLQEGDGAPVRALLRQL